MRGWIFRPIPSHYPLHYRNNFADKTWTVGVFQDETLRSPKEQGVFGVGRNGHLFQSTPGITSFPGNFLNFSLKSLDDWTFLSTDGQMSDLIRVERFIAFPLNTIRTGLEDFSGPNVTFGTEELGDDLVGHGSTLSLHQRTLHSLQHFKDLRLELTVLDNVRIDVVVGI